MALVLRKYSASGGLCGIVVFLQKNLDGTIDIYFGAKAPDGKNSNWIPTDANGEFEVLFRLYGPEKALFDKTWKLPDIEKSQ